MTPSGEGEPKLFRKIALESMGGRNRLNTLSPLISPQMWIVTASLAFLLTAVVTWGFVGRIPVTVLGSGIFLRGERLDTVNSPMEGLIHEMRKSDGDHVLAGECIAIVSASASAADASTQVLASADGTIVSVETEDWDFVTKGQIIALIATGSDAPTCIAFVPLAEGKRIEIGMPVRAAFSNVNSYGGGQAIGQVSAIDGFVTDPDQMFGRVPSAGVIESIRERFGTVTAFVVAIDRDPNGHGGLRWTTSSDRSTAVTNGTLCDIEVTVGQVRPIALLLPGLGEIAGSSP
ncbi:MAG: HlyD family efflux transporter periplasmic adaptor subunit [Phycisphaerales bacterium]|nr:HlyD family efflux transporter periplasmic adaptor subunit [Phycisphaerales bacterium]